MDLQLLVRIRSYFSLPDGGPKTWQQGKSLPRQVVDRHNYGLMQLVDFIAEHCLWGSKQYITLWRELDNDSIEIKSDQQLLEWFELNAENGVVRIVAQINDVEGPSQFSPAKHRCHPSVRNRVPTNETAINIRVTSETATNIGAKSTSKKKRTTYESVGVNESMYSDTDSLVAPSDSSYDSDLAATSCSDDSDPEFDPDGEGTGRGRPRGRASGAGRGRGRGRARGRGRGGNSGSLAASVNEEGMYSYTDSLVAPSDSSYDSDLAATSCFDDSDPEFDPYEERRRRGRASGAGRGRGRGGNSGSLAAFLGIDA